MNIAPEFLEYYRECFGYVTPLDPEKNNKIKQWYYFRSFAFLPVFNAYGELSKKSLICEALNKEGVSTKLIIDTKKEEIEFPIYKSRYLFDGKNSWYVARVPVRQREKGISIANTSFFNPVNEVLPEELHIDLGNGPNPKAMRRAGIPIGDKGNKLVADIIHILSSPFKSAPLHYALKMIKDKGAICVPVNPQWAVSESFTKGYNFAIFRRLTPVALFSDEKEMTIINPMFSQEIRDIFPAVTFK